MYIRTGSQSSSSSSSSSSVGLYKLLLSTLHQTLHYRYSTKLTSSDISFHSVITRPLPPCTATSTLHTGRSANSEKADTA